MPRNKKISLIPPIINPYNEGHNDYFIPLGLLTLAASLKANGFQYTIYKPIKRFINSNDYTWVAQDILSGNPEIVGFSTWCITYPSSLLVANQLKLLSPEITIIFGGPQASILPESTLKNFQDIDYVLAGEADYSFPDLLKELTKQQPRLTAIPGLTFRTESGSIVSNPPGAPIGNLDDLPVPEYSLIKEMSNVKLDAGRGCPFQCTFCTTNSFFLKKYRLKTPDRILYEMKLAHSVSKTTKFNFAHDLFTLNKKFVHELCTKLIQLKLHEGIEFKWTCSARIDCVNNEMLMRMKEAGCESVFFGIESGSEQIQKSIRKNLDLQKVFQVAETCRKAGLNMHASFITGFPDETKKDLEKTLKCALKLSLMGALVQISELSLLPGTPLYNQYHQNLKLDGYFSNFSNSLCNPAEINLIKEFPKMFSSFYYLPVSTISHSQMHCMCRIINTSFYFRNTVYLLKELISNDTDRKNVLHLFKKEIATRLKNKHLTRPWVSMSVNILRDYILKNKHRISHKELPDVFTFEAFQALLTTQYNHWQIIKNRIPENYKPDVPFIKPLPSWKILETTYNLNLILPDEHNWNGDVRKKKKGRFSYLLVVETDVKCKRIKINATDEFLLNLLSETTVEDYLKTACSKVRNEDATRWLKKMKKLGILDIKSAG